MGLGARGLVEVFAEVAEDVLLADDRRSVLQPEGGDRVRAGGLDESSALVALGRHLAVEVVQPELGQSLPDPAGGGTPFGLEELEHVSSPPPRRSGAAPRGGAAGCHRPARRARKRPRRRSSSRRSCPLSGGRRYLPGGARPGAWRRSAPSSRP